MVAESQGILNGDYLIESSCSQLTTSQHVVECKQPQDYPLSHSVITGSWAWSPMLISTSLPLTCTLIEVHPFNNQSLQYLTHCTPAEREVVMRKKQDHSEVSTSDRIVLVHYSFAQYDWG